MRVLLDTHALLWFMSGDRRMSGRARQIVADPGNEAVLSVASLWEMTIKAGLGKLTLNEPLEELFSTRLATERIAVLPIEIGHLAALRRLPLHHRDPFDRLIVAQAMAEQMPVVTRDPAFAAYGVDVLWD